MHGLLLAQLRKFVDARYGADAWTALLDEAGLDAVEYRHDKPYPDAHFVSLLRAVPRITSAPMASLAEDFGAFLTPQLFARYGHLGRPEWKTLEFLANAEPLYKAFAAALFGSAAPVLRAARTGPNEVTLIYASHRRLCTLTRGIARGVGAHFGETVTIDERACMLSGAEACTIVIRRG